MTVITKSASSSDLADLHWSRVVTHSPPTAFKIHESFWRMVSLLDDAAGDGKAKLSRAKTSPSPYLRRCREFLHQNAEGDTQLHIAVVQELPIMVEDMVRSVPHPGLLDVRNDDRQTALHVAVLTRQVDVVRCLLEAGADAAKRDKHGNTALHLACQMGDLACVKELTKPRPPAKTKALAPPVPNSYQSTDASTRTVKGVLLPRRHLNLLEAVLLPQDLDVRNFEGEACVHVAAMHGHVDVLGWLSLCGADLNARDGKGGNTALHLAIERGIDRVSRYLVDGPCVDRLEFDTRNYAGQTAFDLALGVNPLLAGVIASLRH